MMKHSDKWVIKWSGANNLRGKAPWVKEVMGHLQALDKNEDETANIEFPPMNKWDKQWIGKEAEKLGLGSNYDECDWECNEHDFNVVVRNSKKVACVTCDAKASKKLYKMCNGCSKFYCKDCYKKLPRCLECSPIPSSDCRLQFIFFGLSDPVHSCCMRETECCKKTMCKKCATSRRKQDAAPTAPLHRSVASLYNSSGK